MTNREAFNKHLREEIEKQIEFFENMSNQELIDNLEKSPSLQISKKIGNELNWFRIKWFKNNSGNWVGINNLVEWLDCENHDLLMQKVREDITKRLMEDKNG